MRTSNTVIGETGREGGDRVRRDMLSFAPTWDGAEKKTIHAHSLASERPDTAKLWLGWGKAAMQ